MKKRITRKRVLVAAVIALVVIVGVIVAVVATSQGSKKTAKTNGSQKAWSWAWPLGPTSTAPTSTAPGAKAVSPTSGVNNGPDTQDDDVMKSDEFALLQSIEDHMTSVGDICSDVGGAATLSERQAQVTAHLPDLHGIEAEMKADASTAEGFRYSNPTWAKANALILSGLSHYQNGLQLLEHHWNLILQGAQTDATWNDASGEFQTGQDLIDRGWQGLPS